MIIPETLATEHRRTKQLQTHTHNTKQDRRLKRWSTRTLPKYTC